MTRTMTKSRSKNKISRIIGTRFTPKTITFFSVISKNPVDILFKQPIDNIK